MHNAQRPTSFGHEQLFHPHHDSNRQTREVKTENTMRPPSQRPTSERPKSFGHQHLFHHNHHDASKRPTEIRAHYAHNPQDPTPSGRHHLFPHPLNIMHHKPSHKQPSQPPTRFRSLALYWVPIGIIFLLSVVVFVSEAVATILLSSHVQSHRMFVPSATGPYAVSVGIVSLPTNMAIGTSATVGFLSLISALAFWELRNKERWRSSKAHMWTWTCVNLIAIITALIVVTAGAAVVFVAQHRDGAWITKEEQLNRRIQSLTATRESWLCGLDNLKGWQGEWATVGCGFALAGKWTLIPLGVWVIFLTSLCLFQLWQTRALRRPDICVCEGQKLKTLHLSALSRLDESTHNAPRAMVVSHGNTDLPQSGTNSSRTLVEPPRSSMPLKNVSTASSHEDPGRLYKMYDAEDSYESVGSYYSHLYQSRV